MTEKKNNESKWKDYLLKSSLPLEQIVAEKLEKIGIYIAGEYPYIRTNEQNISTEFSIDLHAFELIACSGQEDLYWSNLNFLIECKYNYPGVMWLFLPILDSSLQVANSIRSIEELSNKQLVDNQSIYTIDNQLQFCSKGVEIHSGGFDSNSILHGLSQLRYGLPNMIVQSMITQITTSNEEDLHIHFICPILVTTANLYIIKKGLTLNTYFSAISIDDVANNVDALITFQENGPHLLEYSKSLVKTINEHYPEIQATLSRIKSVNKSSKKLLKSELIEFIAEEYSPIIIVHLDALENVIQIIRDSIKNAEKYLEKIAELRSVAYPIKSSHYKK